MFCRCICPHSSYGSRCKILSRHFDGNSKKSSKNRRDSNEEDKGGGNSWAWLPSIPACSDVHLSLEILTKQQNAILLYNGPNHFLNSDYSKISSEKIIGKTRKTRANGNNQQGNSRKYRTKSMNSRHNKKSELKSNERQTSWKRTREFRFSDRKVRHRTNKREIVRPSPVNRDSFFQSKSTNFNFSKIDNKTKFPPKLQEEAFSLELIDGRPRLLLDLGGGATVLSLNESYSLADNVWHRVDVIWKDQVSIIVILCLFLYKIIL